MLPINHPTNDPSLVSYHRPELLRILDDLEVAYDCWMGLNGVTTDGEVVKQKYLHKEPGEPKVAYQERLHRATYVPIYRDAIRGYAGLLGRFELIDVPTSMTDNQDNIDLHGSSIQSFLGRCDEKVLRDGGVYIMVDMLPSDGNESFLDQQRDGRSPYLLQIDRADVINWQVENIKGRQRVVQATVRQYRPVRIPNSFGSKVEPVYHVLEPGIVTTYTVEKTEKGWRNNQIDRITTSIPFVPLIWYGATNTNFAVSEMPMQGLATMSLQHFQMRSDLIELLHKCAMPVPVRKGAVAGANGQMPPLVLGPNTAVDLDTEGDFKFAEPTGQSLLQHQQEIKHIEQLMDRSSLNFLYGSAIKTATEASLRSSQVAAQVAGMIRTKVSAFNTVMRLWALFAGEQEDITPESGLAMNDSLINKPIDPSGIAQLVNLYRESLLSRRTILEELRRGGILDPDVRIDAELERIDEEAATIQPQTKPASPTQLAAENQQTDTQGTTAEINR